MHHLLVIDDRRIRKKVFAEAEKIIKKIDRLERNLESFSGEDQRHFSSWFDLTFREEKKRIADRDEEYRRLARFHNWIIAVAEQNETSMSAAYALLREEEDQYANGSEAQRAKIDEARRQRDQFLREAVQAEFGSDFDAEIEDDDWDDRDRFDAESELNAIRQMSDEEIRTIGKDRDAAFDILEVILTSTRSIENHELFLRVWNLVSSNNQDFFAKEFKRQTNVSLKTFIEDIEFEISGRKSHDEQSGDSSSSFSPSDCRGEKKVAADHEQIKITYHKIVRYLHPDRHPDQTTQPYWQKSIWLRAQEAYERKDGRALERLYHLLLIRGRILTELKISEIIDSQVWLNEELDELKRQAKQLKGFPAWGFSKRTDYAPLKRKLERPLRAEFEDVDGRVQELKRQHAYLESIARRASS